MKHKDFTLFFRIGCILTTLLIAEELFLIIASVVMFGHEINNSFMIFLVILPSLLTLVYALNSLIYKTKSIIQIFPAVLMYIAAAANIVLVYFLPPLGFLVCGILDIVGIILYISGFGFMEKSTPYGITLISASYFPFAFFAYGMISSEGGNGPMDAMWTIILIPVLCVLIAIDIAHMKKHEKVRSYYEKNDTHNTL